MTLTEAVVPAPLSGSVAMVVDTEANALMLRVSAYAMPPDASARLRVTPLASSPRGRNVSRPPG